MQAFTYNQAPGRVVFGIGAIEQLGREIELLGATRVLVLSTPGHRGQAEDVARRLGARAAGIYDQARMHVPVETARSARAEAERLAADCCVAIGGGSTIGLAKAIALVSGLPILAVPTTYSGSEMTAIHGITEAGLKKTGRDARVLPKTVIYDPALTLGMPARLSATSGMNAIAHAVEALYVPDANPVTSIMAEEGLRALAQGLPRVIRDPASLGARSDCLYGAWLCGVALGTVGVALHHKLCHTLGGTWNLSHADTHTVVLPHAVAYNCASAPEAMRRIERALGIAAAAGGDAVGASGAANAAQALYDLALGLGAPVSLKEIGMNESDLDRAAQLATQAPYPNPRPVEYAGIRKLLHDAYHGHRPK
jgi:maleylacetate reductase